MKLDEDIELNPLNDLFRVKGLLDKKIKESDPNGERRFNAKDVLVAARCGFIAGMEYASDIMDGKA